MDHRTKEALRYLGYGRNPGEERTLELIRQSFEELEGLREERIVWRREPVTVREPDQVETAGMDIRSRGLARNLKGCLEVILVAATLGTRTDLLLRRYSRTDMTRAVILQACAAARLEEYLDAWQEERKKELEEEGLYLRPRFSPGYGDFLHPSSESPASAPGGVKTDRAYHDRRLYADAVQIGDGSGRDLPGGDSLPPAGVRKLREDRLRLPPGVRDRP